MTDGTKFPPYIVLKRKKFPKISVKGIIVQAQEAGWMEYLLDYIFNTLPVLIRRWEIQTYCYVLPG
jgi:hypothetical protein